MSSPPYRDSYKSAKKAFSSRLHWHCHFIQKFESECAIEHRALNSAYQNFPYRHDDKVSEDIMAWEQGQTGITMVDAAMRCLNASGYINFRMRAMLVSFLCHHLNIHWRHASHHLARQFLDFDPGIHYPQLQMQAGVTGINTIRIYNPIKQALEHDPDGRFIARWLPELEGTPSELLSDPTSLGELECQMLGLNLPELYRHPIVDIELAAKEARDRLWAWRKKPEVRRDLKRILDTHVKRLPASA